MKNHHAYIMTNKSRTLYTGVSSNLERRVYEHKNRLMPGFASKYNISCLVYHETFLDIREAIAREKQIKGLLRSKKIALIESTNPDWKDLHGLGEGLRFFASLRMTLDYAIQI